MMTPLPHVPDECVRIDDYWGGALAEPLGSSRPRCRSRTPPPSIRVCGREVESGRVMACPGCGQVKLPKPPTEASAW